MATIEDVPEQVRSAVLALSPQKQAEVLAALDARKTADTNLDNAVAILRQWASEARGTTVTAGNAVAVLQTVVNRLGVFFDRFADLLEVQGRGASAGPAQQKTPG